jgi:hypothetical protein
MRSLWLQSLKAPALLYDACLMFIGFVAYTLTR